MSPRRFLLQMEPVGPPMSNSNSDGTNILESHFDTNMVIILAALLLALICTLGLNSIVRYALRCSSNRFAVTASYQQSSVALGNTGIKKRTLNQIPVTVYGSGHKILGTECPICLGDFADGEKVRILPRCNHGFHVGCIDIWLRSHSSCPNCRRSLLEKPSTTISHDASTLAAPPPPATIAPPVALNVPDFT